MCYDWGASKGNKFIETENSYSLGIQADAIWRMNIMKKMNRITALVVAGIISCTHRLMVMASDSVQL